nr:MAG TPA: hypothetical protein [Caudoviricetes sp.]
MSYIGPNWGAPQQQAFPQNFQQPQRPAEVLTIDTVNGESMANSYYVAPGVTSFLVDFSNGVFYLKSVSSNGVPQKLRVFEFNERSPQAATPVNSVSTETTNIQSQIDELKSMMSTLMANQQSQQSNNNYNRNNKENRQNKGGN